MKLYWRPGTASMAPHAALAEIGVAYELELVEQEDAAGDEYRRLNPWGRVPTLVHDGLVLTESAAIMLHLADAYPEARLAPDERAHFYRWLVFLTNTVQPALMRFFYPERYGDTGVQEKAVEELQRDFALVDRALEGREWLAAEHRTAADLYLFMLTRWGRRLDPPAWENASLRAHFLRTLALPGVARMIEEQGLDLPDWAA